MTEQPEWGRALEQIECRGPDACAEDSADGAALGHTRLAIIGLGAAGAQPYGDPQSGLLSFNGEIYNYREMARQLDIEPDSDTRVLFEILRRGDLQKLNQLRGMFAFVYWSPVSHTFITGRDPFGIKPLYRYLGVDGELSFASVAGALATLHRVTEASSRAIAGFLATGMFPAGTSPFRGIDKLRPGVVTTWTRRGSTWDEKDFELDLSAWPDMAVADAIEDSVRAHMVADVPVGVLMSGGVDSTLVAALAAQHAPELRTYSLTNPDHPSIDEAQYAAWNAALIGSNHTEVPVRPADLAKEGLRLLKTSGEPFGDPAFLPLSVLCSRVADDLKVVLAGEGADELFGGYRRYDVERILYSRIGRRPAQLVGRLADRWVVPSSSENSARARTLEAWADGPGLLSHSTLLFSEWSTVSRVMPVPTEQAWSEALLAWNDLDASPIASGLPRYRAYDLCTWLPNVFLEKSDRASMANSVEVRVPFLDGVVARAAVATMPRDTKKRPLRSMLQSVLPEVRLPPKKMGLSVATLDLVREPIYRQPLAAELRGEGLLGALGKDSLSALARRTETSSAMAYRVAVVGQWAELWGISPLGSQH